MRPRTSGGSRWAYQIHRTCLSPILTQGWVLRCAGEVEGLDWGLVGLDWTGLNWTLVGELDYDAGIETREDWERRC